MARDTTVQFRIDSDVKDEAFAVFREMGITPSEAVRVFFKQVQKTRSLPFVVTADSATEVDVDMETGYIEWLRDRLHRTIKRLDSGEMASYTAGEARQQLSKKRLARRKTQTKKPLSPT